MADPKTSEAKRRANAKWSKANADRYERINLQTAAGTKADIAAAAAAAGESISQYMVNAAHQRMEREGNGDNDNGTR